MPTSKPTVLLLHGLFNSPKWLFLLKNHLVRAGFVVNEFYYHSTKKTLTAHSAALNQHLLNTHNPSAPLHIVAHSLGGLLARTLIVQYPNWKIGRVVTLGTPHLGSVCADFGKRFLPFLLTNPYQNALDGQCPALPDDIELGSIAGSRSVGLGLPIIKFYQQKQKLDYKDSQNDGTVFVFETHLPNAKDHLIIYTSHLGLLHNLEVANQAIYFLENGQFLKP